MYKSKTNTARPLRACDKCFSTKERCFWSEGQDMCDRCTRLSHFCQTQRPRGKVGRKPLPKAHSTITFFQQQPSQFSSSPSANSQDHQVALFSVPRTLSTFAYLTSPEKDLLFSSLERTKGYTTLLMASRFVAPVKQAILTRLDAAPSLLKDALLAASGGMILDKGQETAELTHELNYKRAAAALVRFRSFEVSDSTELSLYIGLAVAVINFGEFVQDTESSFMICQYALNIVKPIYDTGRQFDYEDNSVIAILVYLETAESFLRGSLPTLRYRVPEDNTVCRSLGLSLPLLPHMYELSSLGFSLSQKVDVDSRILNGFLDQIQCDLEQWRPTPPPRFHKDFTEGERAQILAQAQVLRLALLLLIHRFRYPFGVGNDKAVIISSCIIRELDNIKVVTQQVVRHATFPFLVAAIEMVDQKERQRALSIVPEVVPFSTKHHARLKRLLLQLWSIRDTNTGVYWFNFSQILRDNCKRKQ